MHFTDDVRKSTSSKLLNFRSPGLELRGMDNSPDINPALELTPEQVPHDIAMLRRPAAVETLGAPALRKHDGLAHDARNLVTSLELLSGLLAEPGVLGAGHQHYAGDLKSLAGPLGALVDRMAASTQHPVSTDGGPVFIREPQRAPLARQNGDRNDAGVMVKSCERLLASIAGPGVTLNISYEKGLGELALHGEGLTRALINLVQNASEAMPGGGRVAITVRKGLGARPSAIVSVQDTGAGIPAHAMGQVFQAGFSSKKGMHKWPATMHYGLGLTIVRDLVEAAGGSVRVVSALKKGTTFEMKLPCRRA